MSESTEARAARLAADDAAQFLAHARVALERLDARGVQSYCSAAIRAVPGHPEARALMEAANHHGWSCTCDPCRKGVLPSGRVVGGPVEDVPQGDGKKGKG